MSIQFINSISKRFFFVCKLPVLGGLDGTGLESFDSAVTDKINDGRFADTLLDIIARDLCNEKKKVNKLFSEFTLNSQQIYNMLKFVRNCQFVSFLLLCDLSIHFMRILMMNFSMVQTTLLIEYVNLATRLNNISSFFCAL